jgi:hypothetical protein
MGDIKLYLDNTSTTVSGRLDEDLYKNFTRALGYQPEDAMWRQQQCPWWDGWETTVCGSLRKCKCAIKKDGVHFPTGLISKALEYFRDHDITYDLTDTRDPAVASSLGEMHWGLAPDIQLYPYQTTAVGKSIQAQRGIIKVATGGGKCLGKGTPVLMYDGRVVPVEQIRRGDLLMGPDSKPRKVVSTCRGREQMYRVIPTKGEPYVVNESHILSLKVNTGKKKPFIKNLSVKEYLTSNKTFKHCAKGWRCRVEFTNKPLTVDPYYLGLWLGDGTSRNCFVTTADQEIKTYLAHSVAPRHGLLYWEEFQPDNRSVVCHLSKTTGKNSLLGELQKLKLIQNKHIPLCFKANSKENRLRLLAGLMDSDGCEHHGGFDFVSKHEILANDVAFVARSLGLAAYVKPCIKTCCNNGKKGRYFRVSISGDCSSVPNLIARKKCSMRLQKKDVLVTGIQLQNIGEGDYYGFEINGDHLFMLGDFTVTHNTVIAAGIIAELSVSPTIFYVTSNDLLIQAKAEIERFLRCNGVTLTVGAVGGGQKKIGDITVMTVQTAIRACG